MRKIYTTCFILFAGIFFSTLQTSAQLPVKKVLLEEFTTASCGNCPPRSALVTEWNDYYSANSVLMSIHEGSGVDAMSSTTTAAIFNAMHPTGSWFAPAIMINRGIYPWVDVEPYLSLYLAFNIHSTPGIDSVATRLINEPAKVGVDISGTYTSGTRTINATVSTTFVDTVSSGDWRISLFLVEDNVVGWPGLGPFQGWDQECYDATWGNTHYPGMFDGTFIMGYPHRHVMRNALLGTWGAAGIIPAVPVVGTNYSTTANLIVDTAYNENNLSLVAFVSSYGASKSEKYVLNANDVALTNSFSTGIAEYAITSNGNLIENIYPMPSHGKTIITYSLAKESKTEITVCNMTGQTVEVLTSSVVNAGRHQVSFDASKLSKGMYYVSLNTSSGKVASKFIVN